MVIGDAILHRADLRGLSELRPAFFSQGVCRRDDRRADGTQTKGIAIRCDSNRDVASEGIRFDTAMRTPATKKRAPPSRKGQLGRDSAVAPRRQMLEKHKGLLFSDGHYPIEM
ncbi:hypothetical protein TNCV_1041131 [Trichonephila clavipes]|nr:hypothetical protein TNCV_1041131 [Trichonephila clavipes]